MIKFNKSTHLVILFTFAIIFIVLYLYYTINDVKKINNEMKKITTDIQKMNSAIEAITGSLNNLSSATNNLIIQKQSHVGSSAVVNPHSVSKGTQVKNVQSSNESRFNIDDDDDEEEEDDATSVNTEELKKIINENDENDVEDRVENEDDLKMESVIDDQEQDLNKLSYEELKDLCKKKNLSVKGKKGELIDRLNSVING